MNYFLSTHVQALISKAPSLEKPVLDN